MGKRRRVEQPDADWQAARAFGVEPQMDTDGARGAENRKSRIQNPKSREPGNGHGSNLELGFLNTEVTEDAESIRFDLPERAGPIPRIGSVFSVQSVVKGLGWPQISLITQIGLSAARG